MWASEDEPQGFCLATLETLMKYWPGSSHLVIKRTPRVPDVIPLMAIGYTYNSINVLVFIATEGAGSNELGDPYLSRFPNMYSNVYICPVFFPHLLVRYLNALYAIYNHNRMRQSDPALEKYWLTQSGYFILATTVSLGMGITDGKLLFCHSVSEGNMDKNISTK